MCESTDCLRSLIACVCLVVNVCDPITLTTGEPFFPSFVFHTLFKCFLGPTHNHFERPRASLLVVYVLLVIYSTTLSRDFESLSY